MQTVFSSYSWSWCSCTCFSSLCPVVSELCDLPSGPKTWDNSGLLWRGVSTTVRKASRPAFSFLFALLFECPFGKGDLPLLEVLFSEPGTSSWSVVVGEEGECCVRSQLGIVGDDLGGLRDSGGECESTGMSIRGLKDARLGCSISFSVWDARRRCNCSNNRFCLSTSSAAWSSNPPCWSGTCTSTICTIESNRSQTYSVSVF